MRPLKTPPLEKHIHIWHADLSLINHFDHSILQESELKNTSALHFEEDKRYALLSWVLRRQILGHYLNKDPGRIIFDASPQEKPFLDHDTQLSFNLSHSGNQFIMAIAHDRHLGIDVEQIKTDRPVLAIAKRFFSESEYLFLESTLPKEQVNTFYQLWALKEALVKAASSGVIEGFKHANVVPALKKKTIVNEFHLETLFIDSGCAGALAYSGEETMLCFFDVADNA
jgi:4'-phosphopantetheinyl transferase